MAQNISDYQLKYNGLVLGRDTPYGIRAIRGLYDMDVESGATPIPRGDGDIPGEDFIRAKSIEIELVVEGPRASGELAGYIADVRATFQRQAQPKPLWVKKPGDDEVFIRARPIGRAIQEDVQSEHGLKPITLRLHAPDPRLYSTDSKSTLVDIYQPDSGSTDFDLNFAVNFSAAGLDRVIHNAGDARAYPILKFFGPETGTVTGVTISNDTTGQEIEIQADILTDQVLVADMLAYVRADGSQVIGIDGSSRYGDWQTPREPFYLLPGDNIIRYTVSGTSLDSEAQIIWYDTSI